MTKPGWDADIAQRVGRAVKSLREAETPRMSAAKLAERTGQYGFALTKAQISDLELGRKKTVTVAELITLAAALGRPPIELLYPDLPEAPVDVWPEFTTTSFAALQWFSGEITGRDIADIPLTAASTNDRVQSAREYARLKSDVGRAARKAIEEDLSSDALEALRSAKNLLAERKSQLRQNGWPVDDDDE